jgi:hypothetical protein
MQQQQAQAAALQEARLALDNRIASSDLLIGQPFQIGSNRELKGERRWWLLLGITHAARSWSTQRSELTLMS